MMYCQALDPNPYSPNPLRPTPTQSNLQGVKVGLREAATNFDAQLRHRIIFVNTQITWLVQIPDKALCDSFLCGIFFAEIRRIKALTHDKLNEVTSNFVASLDDKETSLT